MTFSNHQIVRSLEVQGVSNDFKLFMAKQKRFQIDLNCSSGTSYLKHTKTKTEIQSNQVVS